MGVGVLPRDDNGTPVLGLVDDATGNILPVHVGAIVTGADGKKYAKLDVNASVTATVASVGTSGAAIPASSDLAGAKDGSGNLQPLQTDGTNLLTKESNSAAMKTDLDTIVTNTNKIPASPATEGGNLATLAGVVSSSKAAVKAASGDFATGAIVDLPAKGTAVMVGSTPVTIATDDTQMTAIKNSVANIPAKGAAATSASTPVNVASDQVVPVKRSAVAVYSLASTATSGTTQNSGDLTVGLYTEIALDINVTAQAGTNPTLQFFYERKGADGIYYVLWQTTTLTAATQVYTVSIGAGMNYNESLGSTGRLRWVVGGTATPTFTFSANITGK